MHRLRLVTFSMVFACCLLTKTRGENSTCTLCEDGSPLPQPDLPIVPDRNGTLQTCYDLEADAQISGLPCNIYQGTHGVYCGCNNPIASSTVCQICGMVPLPDPSKLTLFKGPTGDQTQQIACGLIEFANSLSNETCEVFQARYNETCCEEMTEDASSSNGSCFAVLHWLALFGLVLVLPV